MAPVSICKKLESLRNQFFIGSELGEKKMSWVSWNKCLASKKRGGLGIGSIYGLNVGLLFKWIWTFLLNSSDLWIKVIKNLYGQHGGIFDVSTKRSSLSPWCDRNCNIANRVSLQDWNQVLRRIPRGGIEASQLANLKSLIGDVVLSDQNDSWNWSLDAIKGFSVASARSLIDSHFLEVSPTATRWNNSIHIKVNIFL
ncbi:RNA-directed DNA polymerase, eukaryota [Artemisia annua]|uniref:RNA-directed DNA polymerase, eukaryota n=1 Tax=Artemisia annua TaxID=35608 RepID=A0A2U1KA40_ARTAN|nr:RNA-directed DNA polymerase, eukaryota [Artemisia annua]